MSKGDMVDWERLTLEVERKRGKVPLSSFQSSCGQVTAQQRRMRGGEAAMLTVLLTVLVKVGVLLSRLR